MTQQPTPNPGNESSSPSARHGVDLRPGLGFRIRRTRSEDGLPFVERFRKFATSDIADRTNQFYVLDPDIKAQTPEARFVATACTVRVAAGDNLMVHKALDIAKPGQVLVVDTGGLELCAVLGDLVGSKAKYRGIAGVVVDGLVRDLMGLREVGLPVFARGASTMGPTKRGPGEINYPVCCGGVVVNAGDLVIADPEGIVIVPPDEAESLLTALEQSIEKIESYRKDVYRGKFSNAWVDQIFSPYPGIIREE